MARQPLVAHFPIPPFLQDHAVYRRRLDAQGNTISGDILHEVGPQNGPVPATLVNNGTASCGSCYGAEREAGQCCNTCEEVREAYRMRGWAVQQTESVEQCKHDKYLQEVRATKGEGCRVWGQLSINKVGHKGGGAGGSALSVCTIDKAKSLRR